MPRIISFALGTTWSWYKPKNFNTLLSKIGRKLNVDGIEFTIADKSDLNGLKLSKPNIAWLRSLKYVSIHAPFGLVEKSDNEKDLINQLDIIFKIYHQIRAKNVVIHPNNLPTPSILKKYRMNIAIENLPPKRHYTIAKLKRILKKYPGSTLCLDISHAYLWGPDETAKLIKAFGHKISQVHLSGTYRKKDHQSLRITTERFNKSIEPIKKIKAPIIQEAEFPQRVGLKYLKDEIEYIRQFFN